MDAHGRRALQTLGDGKVALRRRSAAAAGHTGDEATARLLLGDPDASVRATALGALVRLGALTTTDAEAMLSDPSASVRRRLCELAPGLPPVDLAGLLDDEEVSVVEAACFALGEQRDAGAVARLSAVSSSHDDPLCRESAVAALGAIGCEEGLPAILAALSDKATVRRRAVIALAPFEGPEVEAALAAALSDRDWQVRQAAEDLTGREAPASPDAPTPPEGPSKL
jgi:HEAT repeat protein